jgi:hypothetical protein
LQSDEVEITHPAFAPIFESKKKQSPSRKKIRNHSPAKQTLNLNKNEARTSIQHKSMQPV